MRNTTVDMDAYKLLHHLMQKPGYEWLTAYAEPRVGARYDENVIVGLHKVIQDSLGLVTKDKVKEGADLANKIFGFDGLNTEIWNKVAELGYIPCHIKGIPEGHTVPTGTPILTIEPTEKWFAPVCNGLETSLMRIWYPITLASRLKKIRDKVDNFYEISGTPELAEYAINDFSARSASVPEQADLAGMVHLMVCGKGSDNVGGQTLLNKVYGENHELASVWACYDDETEVLTENGFKLFKDVEGDEKVAQYFDNGNIDFVVPNFHYADPYKGKIIDFSDTSGNLLNLSVTPNHKMVILNSIGEVLPLREASQDIEDSERLPLSGIVSYQGKPFNSLDALRVAFQADGSFSSRKEAYTGELTGTIPIRFSFKKEDKAYRLEEILSNLKFEFSKHKYENGYYSYRIAVPKELGFEKNFDWIKIYEVSKNWIKSFLIELCNWDATASKSRPNNISYLSIEKSCVEKVQTLAHLIGAKATFNIYEDKRKDYNRQIQYRTNINLVTSSIKYSKVVKTERDYNGIVYCVGVPSKKLVVRKNNTISICGNTEHSVALSFGPGEGEYEYIKHQLRTNTSAIKSIVADTYDYKNFVEVVMRREDVLDLIEEHEGRVVIRPDSGNFFDNVLWTLESLGKFYGTKENDKGYKVVDYNIGVIQGDGMNEETIIELYSYILANGWSANNIVVGAGTGIMYEGLTRDTQRFAIKPSANIINGKFINTVKDPKTDPTKRSRGGMLKVDANYVTHSSMDYEDNPEEFRKIKCIMETYYINGKMKAPNFEEIMERLKY